MKRNAVIFITAIAVLVGLLLLEPRMRAIVVVHGVFSAPIAERGTDSMKAG